MSPQRLRGKRILIVDDEPDLREVISFRLQMLGCEVEDAANGAVAIDLLRKRSFDAVITDIRMPEGNGIELLELIHRDPSGPAVILISGFADVRVEDMVARGASTLLVKPFDLEDVVNAVLNALLPRL